MKVYSEAEFLALSGIQHFSFCRRQWALIHIEQQWKENLRTVQGRFLHERTDEGSTDKRGLIIITRSVPVFSARLGTRGICDVVELHSDRSGVPLFSREGLYVPVPVEYKRGRPKEHDADQLQLCTQAMCLEEMLVCSIKQGFLYYGETRRRTRVEFDEALRAEVIRLFTEMHEMFGRRYTPKAKPSARCHACSLMDYCIPRLGKRPSVAKYIERRIEEEH